MTKIEVENLTKIFGFGPNVSRAKKMLKEGVSKDEIVRETDATVAVNDISFSINSGETFVVMGLSGSGKSTLIRMINRLVEPTEGSIKIDGEDITQVGKDRLREIRRTKVNMVFQSFALFPNMTILENTEYGLEIKGVDKEIRRKRAEKALDNSGLLSYKDQYPDQLSGGMQQRVGLARALANDADILLMDEAFSALDPLIRKEMQDELVALQESLGKTIVFITHDLDEALKIGDRIALMRDGEVVQIGTAEDFLERPADDYVEDFVEDVDRAKIYTAEDTMKAPHSLTLDKDLDPQEGLDFMEDQKIDMVFITDKDNRLLGYMSQEDLEGYDPSKRGDVAYTRSLLRTDHSTVAPDTSINEIIEVIQAKNMRTPVVDDEGYLLGFVNRALVFDQLSKNGGGDDE